MALTPTAITIGQDPEVRLPSKTFRPDTVALFEETRFFLAECKLTVSSAYLTNWLTEFRSIRRELEESVKKNGYSQSVCVLFVKSKADLEDHVRTEAEKLRVKIIDEREVQYFHTLQKQSGIGISHLFWSRVAPSLIRNQDLRLPALRIKGRARGDSYIFSMNAHDLLARCFVSHRQLHSLEEGQIGFQRMLQKKKLSEIAKYIRERTVFPTPIIVAFSRKPSAVFEPLSVEQKAPADMREVIEFGHLRLPKDVNSIQIIDGQHRLYGYSRLPRSDKHIIQVLAYKDDEGQSLATMFVDINSKQTKVPSSLLWELYPDIYGELDPEHWKADISNAVEAAARRAMQGRVEHISSGLHGPISFQTLCTEVKRAKLLEDLKSDKGALQVLLDAFFTTLKELGEEHKGVNEGYIFSNNGITPMIRTAKRIVQYEVAHNRRDNLKKKNALQEVFTRYFAPVYKKYAGLGAARLEQMRKRTGNSGFNAAEDEITDAIRADYLHDFPYRPKKTPPQWERAVDRSATLIKTINEEAADSGKSPGLVFRDFNLERFKKALARPIDTEDSFSGILSQLYKDILEGSGKDGPDGRIKSFLGLSSISDNPAIGQLNLLRIYWEHNTTQIDAVKRQRAIKALGDLCGKPNLVNRSELDKTDWQRAALQLVENLTKQLLEPLLSGIRSPNP